MLLLIAIGIIINKCFLNFELQKYYSTILKNLDSDIETTLTTYIE